MNTQLFPTIARFQTLVKLSGGDEADPHTHAQTDARNRLWSGHTIPQLYFLDFEGIERFRR